MSAMGLLALSIQLGHAQITFKAQDKTIQQVLQQLERESGYNIFYSEQMPDLNKTVSVSASNDKIETVLNRLLKGTDIVYRMESSKQIVLTRRAHPSTQPSRGKKITGTVVDSKGEPLIGVTVAVDGTTQATITDIDGHYQLEVPANATLKYSYVGFSPATVRVGTKNTYSVTLQEDHKVLDEVVVVGYGTATKKDLTGAVATVKMDDALGSRPLTKASDALVGAVPGLMASSAGNAPGKSRSFQIRGAYSIGSGSTIAPLVLIDNVEGSIDMLNPEDIESVTVLKDAASAAIYGARAAGGVILVTTKRPKSDTRFQVNYNNNVAFSNAINLPRQASLADYLQTYADAAGDQYWSLGAPSVSRWQELLKQYKANPSSLQTYGDGMYKDENGAIYFLNEKDLVKNMLETSFQHTHNLSVSGGTKAVRYRLSSGFTSQDGVLITNKDKFVRKNISAFVSADVTKWFTQEANFSYARSNNSLPQSALGAIYSTRLSSFYPEGNMPAEIEDISAGAPFFTPANQIRWSNASNTENSNPRIFLHSILRPLKNFEVNVEYTYDRRDYDYYYYTGKNSYTTIQGGVDTTPTNDYLEKQKSTTSYNALNIYGTYTLKLTDHHFKFMAGFNQESSSYNYMTSHSYGQAVPEVPSLGGGTSTLKMKDGYDEYSVRGGFFRANYDYKNRYLFEANGRYDGSSKFPKSSRFSFFPSVSAGWNVAEEEFMAPTRSWLDGLKLRASYGMIGNQNISTYAFIPTMPMNNKYNGWLVGGNYTSAITDIPSLVSANFTWEKAKTLDFGVDVTMLNNRLTATFDWYQRNTDGMLAPGMQLPAVVGAKAPYENTADMRTRGWDLSLNWRDKIGQFGYRVGFSLSDYNSVIVKYNSNEAKLLSSYYEGQQLGEIWGYVNDGFYTADDFVDTKTFALKEGVTKIDGYNPRPGDFKFKNLMDDNQTTNVITSGEQTYANPGDRKVIGNDTPRYVFGMSLGANYKGFDLSVFLQGTAKRDAWLANTLNIPLYADYKFVPLYEGLADYWKPTDAAGGDYTPVNANAKFARIYGNYGNQSSNYRIQDKFLSNAAYLRIKNVTLSYTFPRTLVQQLALSQLKAFVSIENLATFTGLVKGIDPETLSWNYPAFRTISFGVNVTL